MNNFFNLEYCIGCPKKHSVAPWGPLKFIFFKYGTYLGEKWFQKWRENMLKYTISTLRSIISEFFFIYLFSSDIDHPIPVYHRILNASFCSNLHLISVPYHLLSFFRRIIMYSATQKASNHRSDPKNRRKFFREENSTP